VRSALASVLARSTANHAFTIVPLYLSHSARICKDVVDMVEDLATVDLNAKPQNFYGDVTKCDPEGIAADIKKMY
jgi:hypothetical protein